MGKRLIGKDDAAQTVCERCASALKRQYGEEPCKSFIERLRNEEKRNEDKNAWETLELAAKIADLCAAHATPVLAKGDLGTPLLAYLLGITECNPLEPHLYCPKCKDQKVLFPDSISSGFDLMRCGVAQRVCPSCGAPMIGDGNQVIGSGDHPQDTGHSAQLTLDVPAEALPLIRKRFGGALKKLPIGIHANRELSVLWNMQTDSDAPFAPFVPDEQDVCRFVDEGLSGGFGSELFESERLLAPIPQTFSELLRLYRLAVGGAAETDPPINRPENTPHPISQAAAIGALLLKLRLMRARESDPVGFFAAVLTTETPRHMDISLFSKGVPDRTMTPGEQTGSAFGVEETALACIARRIRFLPADLNRSDPVRFLPGKGTILTPLRFPKGTRPETIKSILTERRKAPFVSEEDVVSRANLSDREQKAFAACGLFDCFLKEHRFRRAGDVVRELLDAFSCAEELPDSKRSGKKPQDTAAAEAMLPLAGTDGLCLIGGRPAMGKTTTLLRLAFAYAQRKRKTAYVFSSELSAKELAKKLMTVMTDVDPKHIRSEMLTARERSAIENCLCVLDTLPIRLYGGKLRPEAFFRTAREEIEEGMLLLDGIPTAEPAYEPDAAPNPYDEIYLEQAAAAAALKEFAKQWRVPIFAAVPLSRNTERRADHRPTLADVRYHPRLIAEADAVVLLYRDSYYNDGGDPAMQYVIAKNDSRILDSNRHNAR